MKSVRLPNNYRKIMSFSNWKLSPSDIVLDNLEDFILRLVRFGKFGY